MKAPMPIRPLSFSLFPALLLAALVAPAGPALAQAASETFEDATRVLEVQVPVNVFSKDGKPVRGLTAADFQIFDGGQEREITDLRVIDLDVMMPDEETFASQIEAAIPAAARRHFLLLFDLSFSKPTSILRARGAAREFVLNDLHPTDLVAVATHTVEGGAKLVITFTPDRAQLARAIDTLGSPRFFAQGARDPLRFILNSDQPGGNALASRDLGNSSRSDEITNMQQAAEANLNVIGKQMAKMEASFLRGRISSWSRSMAALAEVMESVQGRKHVVFFSEGFDGRLLFGRRPDFADPGTQADNFNIQTGRFFMVDTDDIYGNTQLQIEFAQMLEKFRRADCVLQTVDISGLRADSAQAQRVHAVGQDALFYIANETGGRLFKDANNFRSQLNDVLATTTVTYLLSFQANDLLADGSYHRLKVKADLPRGVRISHRQGYFSPTPFSDLHPLEKNLLASDAIASAAPKTEIDVKVLAAPFRASEERAYVPVIVEVTGASLLKNHDDDSLSVEFYTYVTNLRGEMKDFFTQMVSLDISTTRDRFTDTGLKFYGHLDLEPGKYLVRVLVRNAGNGRTGVKTVALDIPAYDAQDPILLPPFFLEQAQRWFLVREQRSTAFQKSVIYPFTINGEPYVPSAFPVMRESEEVQLCLVGYNFADGQLELTSRIRALDGEAVSGGTLDLVERTVTGIDGLDKLLATFRPTGLEAGSYTLEVAVANPASGLLETNSIPFAVLN